MDAKPKKSGGSKAATPLERAQQKQPVKKKGTKNLLLKTKSLESIVVEPVPSQPMVTYEEYNPVHEAAIITDPAPLKDVAVLYDICNKNTKGTNYVVEEDAQPNVTMKKSKSFNADVAESNDSTIQNSNYKLTLNYDEPSSSNYRQHQNINNNGQSTIPFPTNSASGIFECTVSLHDSFIRVLDQLDSRVENFRKDAIALQDKKEFLLMAIDLVKNNDSLLNLSSGEREELVSYLERINGRLSTVHVLVHTIRDHSQQDALSQVNLYIDMLISIRDRVASRQRCQEYLNSCCNSTEHNNHEGKSATNANNSDVEPIDKKFESALLGCTLDDQKQIKRRLLALMDYLSPETR